MTSKPIRLADADRAEAAEVLHKHYSDGRLDASEHEERTTVAWRARFAGDLEPLFADLPAPHPSALTGVHLPVDWNAQRAPVPAPARTTRSLSQKVGMAAVVALAAVLVLVILTTGSWWLIGVVLAVLFCSGGAFRHR